MKHEFHLEVDKFLWNKEYPDIHKWLDRSFGDYKNNTYRHWLNYHHINAIEKEYGSYTIKYNVAYMHILIDWLSHFSIAFVPKDRNDAEEMLKSMDVL